MKIGFFASLPALMRPAERAAKEGTNHEATHKPFQEQKTDRAIGSDPPRGRGPRLLDE
jgi:hypothetical protein